MPLPSWNLSANELRHIVTIQAKIVSATLDSRGHPVRTWEDATWDYAKIETPTGRKLELARQLVPTCTHVITMRYRLLDVQNNRIAFKSPEPTTIGAVETNEPTGPIMTTRYFNIGHQENVEERGVKLVLTCTEVKGVTA